MCRVCREPRGGRAPGSKRERGLGVWGRCKHNLLPPKPACSLGERAPPSQPTWHPSCQGPGSCQGQPTHSPHPLAFPPFIGDRCLEEPPSPENSASKGCHFVEVCLGCQPAPVQPGDLGLTIPQTSARRQATWRWQRAELRPK